MFSSFRTPEWSPRSLWGALEGLLRRLLAPPGRQLRSLGALLDALGRSWVALGTLLGRSWHALGTLLGAIRRSWALLRRSWTLLARFGNLQGLILGSPGSPQSYFKSILSNPSARTRTFRKSAESCPRTVREDSENQIQQRWIASSLLYLYRQEARGRRSSRSELNILYKYNIYILYIKEICNKHNMYIYL